MTESKAYRWWAAALVLLGSVGLATGIISGPRFWNGYVLDIVGPAWNYVLVRGLFSKSQPAMLSKFLNPEAAIILIASACFLIEAAQYLELYDASYDPLDFVAYVSLLIPCYMVDRWLTNRHTKRTGTAS
jgi:drug/metabolite transporter (DMT)-like permease